MKRNGFTLIELLATIAILGVIVLVVTPNFMDTVQVSRMKGYQESLMGVMRAIVQDSAEHDYERFQYEIKNGVISYQGSKINYNGSIDGSGTLMLDLNGRVKLETENGSFCGVKSYEASEISVAENGNCPKFADTSNASAPSLLANMYPIVWSNEKNAWLIADKENYKKSEWYNYDQKRWANAITVTPGKRDTYRKAEVGTVVDPNDVIGYFVWIPRFQYQSFTSGPREIKVQFNTGVTEEDTTMISHPAFQFGGKKLSGFWVGKFETTGTVDQPTILPNQTPVTGESFGAYFRSGIDMSEKATSRQGFHSKKSDTHIMKNTEWGAVAYLSHSKYGTNKEITINAKGTTGGGNYISNVNQSTTGNITGIYDMSGGSFELVMGNHLGNFANAGFTDTPASKYYDYYTSNSSTNYESSITGDAIKELAPFANGTSAWYQDQALMVTSSHPWLLRGGSATSGVGAGIFAFQATEAGMQNTIGYRMVVMEK